MTSSLLLEHFDNLLATPEDVEQIKHAILHLAMQGKLVGQVHTDVPAYELLQKIRAEKVKLNEDGRIQKSENFPPIQENEMTFVLPKGWSWVRLEDICSHVMDIAHNMPKTTDTGVKFISAKDLLDDGRINFEYGVKRISEEDFDSLSKRIAPRRGDIIYSRIGVIGKARIVKTDERFIVSYSCCVIRPLLVDVEYLNYYLDSGIVLKQALGHTKSIGVPDLGMKKIKGFVIALPPLAEQQRIVARVEELFAQTRALAKELEHSQNELDGLNRSALSHLLASKTPEEFNQHWDIIAKHFDLLFQTPEHIAPLRRSILELAVRGKLTRREAGDASARELLNKISPEKEKLGKPASLRKVSKEEKPFDLPQGWEWTRWDDVSLQIGDVDHKMPDEIPDGIPYISPRDFTGKEDISFTTAKKISRKDYEDLAEKIKPERGDIIFPRYGTIGVNRFVSVDFEFLASYSCCIIKHMKGLMNPRYVFFYSISPFLQQETQKYVNKTTQPNVGIKSIQQFLFPLPPLAEQERIVKRVEQLLSLCDALEARLQSAEEERGRLVRAVMAGVGGSNGE